MLRASAAEFVSRTTDYKRTRNLRHAQPGYDADVFKEIAALGWCGILVPEKYDGLGLGFAEMAIVLEELAKGLLGEPLAATIVFGGRALQHGDNAALAASLLSRLSEGGLVPAVAWQEGDGGLDLSRTATRAEAEGNGVRINGRKRFVAGAGAADGFLVSAQSGAGLGLYWVERHAPGVSIDHEWRADGTPSAVVGFSGVRVKGSDVAASAAAGRLALERAVDETILMSCAEMCGVMQATLDMTLEYLRTRVQFGKPIGSFQALQHRSVDLYVQQQLARAVQSEAAAAFDGGKLDLVSRRRLASRAKARACEAGLRIGRDAVQLHGAIAIQDECNVGLYFKRALVLAAWLGNASEHRRRFASSAPQP